MDQQRLHQGSEVIDFLKYAYGQDGDKSATDLSHVTLPQDVKDQVSASWPR
jgi:hypothetical protein